MLPVPDRGRVILRQMLRANRAGSSDISAGQGQEYAGSGPNTMSRSQTIAPVNNREFASVLTSWKEIARYVGKGVRTVQRWERETGFPVRRTKPGKKGRVLAVPREIDSWVKMQRFTDGRIDLATLRRSLRESRIENLELRLENRALQRQLAELRSSQSR